MIELLIILNNPRIHFVVIGQIWTKVWQHDTFFSYCLFLTKEWHIYIEFNITLGLTFLMKNK